MKEYRSDQVTRNFLHYVFCDLCGAQSCKGGYWNHVLREQAETEVRIQVRDSRGTTYPEGGWGDKYDVDLCPNCFRDQLIPWLKSQGADIEPVEWEY